MDISRNHSHNPEAAAFQGYGDQRGQRLRKVELQTHQGHHGPNDGDDGDGGGCLHGPQRGERVSTGAAARRRPAAPRTDRVEIEKLLRWKYQYELFDTVCSIRVFLEMWGDDFALECLKGTNLCNK